MYVNGNQTDGPHRRSPVDLSLLVEAVGDSEEVYHDLIAMFLRQAPEHITQLKDAATTHNDEVLQRTAHTFKSSSELFGANQLAQLCLIIEEAGRHRQRISPQDITLIEWEYERVRTALEQVLGTSA